MYKKVIVVIVSALLVLGCLSSLILKKQDYSEKENRYLAKFPEISLSSLASGEFFNELNDYSNDHFVLRDYWIGLNSLFNKYTLKDEINNVYLGKDGYLIEKYEKIKRTDLIYRSINNFAESVEIPVEVMLVPTSISINTDKLPDLVKDDRQLKDLEEIYNNLKKVKCINITDSLISANNQKDVFYKLDHHWNSYGAYCGYVEFCKANGLVYHDIEDYQKEEVANDFTGTIYSKVGDYTLDSDVIETYTLLTDDYVVNYGENSSNSVYDFSYLNSNDKYGMFLSSNHPLLTITNNDETKQGNILIIKDSYANCFIPFLIDHYKSITLIDPRYYGLSIADYIKENNIEMVLFLYNMNTIGNDTGIRGIE